MEETVHLYGYGDSLASMCSLELGVYDFRVDKNRTEEILLDRGKRAVEEDNAEVLADTADRFSWFPGRKWGSEEPSLDEIKQWGLFKNMKFVGNLLKHDDIP